MAKITLHNNNTSATYVSNHFIDNYMTSANGEYVKIYLYLLRCMNSTDCSFSISSAADKFENTEKDIRRALKYWEKMKLLRLEYDTEKKISGIHFLNSESSPVNEPAPFPAPTVKAEAPKEPQKRSYTATEMAVFQEKEDIRELLFVTEHYLKRPLTPTDMNTILFWYDELHFSADLIEYLIEYCIGKGHTSMRYMDKVAISWQKEGISTVEHAKQSSSSYSQLHFSVMRALGISGRNLISSETEYINKWSKNLGFSQEIIGEACRRTIAATHQPSFEYTDSILARWHQQGVQNISDITRLDAAFQKSKTSVASVKVATNKFNNFSQRTYDYDKLEQQLLRSHSSQEVICP